MFHSLLRGVRERLTSADVRVAEGVEKAENIEQPEHDGDYDDGIENGLNGSLHRDEVIHQPKKHSYDD